MIGFCLHPNVYVAGPHAGLVRMLEQAWVRDHAPGDGTFYIISGFANYNGGVRFYDVFEKHIAAGGKVVSFFSGSSAQRLTSRQVVRQLLQVGVDVTIVNRKRLLHAKCYGSQTAAGESLIVTSGNFTGPGMAQNVEASFFADATLTKKLGFSWPAVVGQLRCQRWDLYRPSLGDEQAPVWQLLYDEYDTEAKLAEVEQSTLLVLLGHSDTARIQASPTAKASLGTQYFWLSRDCYDFFPPLTIRNRRGYKTTYSCVISLNYVDLGVTDAECRVTFEAENNLDFRLGTGKLRNTKAAAPGDIAALTRITDTQYELRILRRRDTRLYDALMPYTINFIGHRGKKYGFISNEDLEKITGFRVVHKTNRC